MSDLPELPMTEGPIRKLTLSEQDAYSLLSYVAALGEQMTEIRSLEARRLRESLRRNALLEEIAQQLKAQADERERDEWWRRSADEDD